MAAPVSAVDRCYQVELRIDPEVCARCGLCVSLCPAKILACADQCTAQVTDIGRCQRCFLCETNCPTHALRFIRTTPSYVSDVGEPCRAPGQDKTG